MSILRSKFLPAGKCHGTRRGAARRGCPIGGAESAPGWAGTSRVPQSNFSRRKMILMRYAVTPLGAKDLRATRFLISSHVPGTVCPRRQRASPDSVTLCAKRFGVRPRSCRFFRRGHARPTRMNGALSPESIYRTNRIDREQGEITSPSCTRQHAAAHQSDDRVSREWRLEPDRPYGFLHRSRLFITLDEF